MTTLLEKRTALIAEHQAMEKHDSLHWAKEAAADRKVSERLIGFQCDDEVCVVGDCVGKLYDGLRKFDELVKSKKDTNGNNFDWHGAAKGDFSVARAIKAVEKALSKPQSTEVAMSTQTWNAYMQALNSVGIHAVLSDGK